MVTDDRIADALAELADALKSRPEATEPAPERLLSVDEARKRLGGISRSMLYQLIGQRRLRTLTIGTRRFVPESAVQEFIDDGVQPVAEPL